METIQMLGNLGEFVGAIAVVATLVYLAIQVRHSKEAMEANTRSMDESRSLRDASEEAGVSRFLLEVQNQSSNRDSGRGVCFVAGRRRKALRIATAALDP